MLFTVRRFFVHTRDIVRSETLLHDVCYDVEAEPTLRLLQAKSFIHKTFSTDEKARLDIKPNDLGCPGSAVISLRRRYLTHSPSHTQKTVEAYKYHESLKCLKYEQQILDVEKSYFVSLVFFCIGGTGPSATRTIKELASKIAEKKDGSLSDAITYIRTRISFYCATLSYASARGCRGSKRRTDIDSSCSAIVREGILDYSSQFSLYRNSILMTQLV